MFKVNLLSHSLLIVGLLLPVSRSHSAEAEKTGNTAVVSPVRAIATPNPAGTQIPNSAAAITIIPGQLVPESLRRPLVFKEIAFCQDALAMGIVKGESLTETTFSKKAEPADLNAYRARKRGAA